MATQKKPLNLFPFFETIRRRANSKVCLFTFLSLFLFLSLFFYSFRDLTYTTADLNFSPNLPPISDELTPLDSYLGPSTIVINPVSILLPDWEVLLILSPEIVVPSRDTLCCVYANNATSPAIFAGYLPSTNDTMFKCTLTESARRRKSLFQPVLLSGSPEKILPASSFAEAPAMMKWSFMAYDSLSIESDVVLFVKGINNRQGTNRSPVEFSCVFGNNSVKTAVTSSTQEVFRCSHPNLTEEIDYLGGDKRIKISLEISGKRLVVPSVAYYTQPLRLVNPRKKSLLCACTMVYNVAKFLREWVIYHSKIGVNRFILYDNNSDDGLQRVVGDLNKEGYHVQTLLWIWPKTQEAGFSHGVVYAKSICDWMMYLDVDEFVFSPSWYNSKYPSRDMLQTLLPRNARWSPHRQIGQVLLSCNEFGPSGKKSHPVEGVTRGYTCRRKDENRHKSIVLLDAVDDSLVNAIHHFGLKKNYRTKHMSMEVGLVNHYKYQAWPEFKAKFRRRVSAYVVDWTKDVNMRSKDRTPGLGFEPIEPQGWARKFCEVRDERLKLLTQRWFGNQTFQLGLEHHR